MNNVIKMSTSVYFVIKNNINSINLKSVKFIDANKYDGTTFGVYYTSIL